jgi:hypothetical protein
LKNKKAFRAVKWGLYLSPLAVIFFVGLYGLVWGRPPFWLSAIYSLLWTSLLIAGFILGVLGAQSDYSSTQSPRDKRKFKNRLLSDAIAAVGAGFFLITVLLNLFGLVSQTIVTALMSLGFSSLLIALLTRLAGLIAGVAEGKGRDWTSFFVLSLFFPLIMWIVVTVIASDPSTQQSGNKTCPHCAELVKSQARLCKHCGSKLE